MIMQSGPDLMVFDFPWLLQLIIASKCSSFEYLPGVWSFKLLCFVSEVEPISRFQNSDLVLNFEQCACSSFLSHSLFVINVCVCIDPSPGLPTRNSRHMPRGP